MMRVVFGDFPMSIDLFLKNSKIKNNLMNDRHNFVTISEHILRLGHLDPVWSLSLVISKKQSEIPTLVAAFNVTKQNQL